VRTKKDFDGIPAGSTGTLIIRDDFLIKTIQFIHSDGKIQTIDLSPAELMESVEICH